MADEKFVQFLRDLADWYSQHSEIPPPYSLEGEGIAVYLFGHDNPQEILRAIGSFEKGFNNEYFEAKKAIGGKTLKFIFYRDKVCTPRVVGKKLIEKTVIPSSFTPEKVIEAHEVEEIEWDCSPVLSPTASNKEKETD
jgi:hypothetical protein